MAERVRFNTAEDYANYLKRLQAVPALIDQEMELLRTGLRENRTPPRVAIQDVAEQFKALSGPHGMQSLAAPFEHLPANVLPSERDKLLAQFNASAFPAAKAALESGYPVPGGRHGPVPHQDPHFGRLDRSGVGGVQAVNHVRRR